MTLTEVSGSARVTFTGPVYTHNDLLRPLVPRAPNAGTPASNSGSAEAHFPASPHTPNRPFPMLVFDFDQEMFDLTNDDLSGDELGG